jgi:RPA family protein
LEQPALKYDIDRISAAAKELIDRYGIKTAEAALDHIQRMTANANMRDADYTLLLLNEVERQIAAQKSP